MLVQYRNLKVTLRELSYLDGLKRNAFNKRFIPALPKGASDEEQEIDTGKYNFTYALQSATTEKGEMTLEGATLPAFGAIRTQKEFDAAFETFSGLNGGFVNLWIAGVASAGLENDDPATKPPERLTAEEKADPQS